MSSWLRRVHLRALPLLLPLFGAAHAIRRRPVTTLAAVAVVVGMVASVTVLPAVFGATNQPAQMADPPAAVGPVPDRPAPDDQPPPADASDPPAETPAAPAPEVTAPAVPAVDDPVADAGGTDSTGNEADGGSGGESGEAVQPPPSPMPGEPDPEPEPEPEPETEPLLLCAEVQLALADLAVCV